MLIFTLALLYVNQSKIRQNKILEEKNHQLEEAALKEKVLTHNAQIDKLTGLYDKITTEKKCARYLKNGGKGAMVVIDIDNFKQINDNFGHSYGDQILKELGRIIHDQCQENDIAGRIGGDEFLLFFKEMEDKEIIDNRLGAFYQQISKLNRQDYAVSCSIGVAVAPKPGSDYEVLFTAADHAMYEAKRSGKNQYSFSGQ